MTSDEIMRRLVAEFFKPARLDCIESLKTQQPKGTTAMILQAIVTKYLGPTNSRGSRVKATASAGSVTLTWDGALNSDANHAAAARALAQKFGWAGRYFGGGLPEGCGNVYVCTATDTAHSDPAFVIEKAVRS